MSRSSLPGQLARTKRFTLGRPHHFTVSPDGETVYFLRATSGDDPVSRMWALNCATGTESLLVDPTALPAEHGGGTSSRIVALPADGACELLAVRVVGPLW